MQNLHSFSLYPIAGIFFLACGAAALNHYQERSTDLLMDRTKNRPIPSGTVTPGVVLLISIAFLILGSVTILLKSNVLTLGIGLLTFFWYNAVYTPLKKVFALAIIPGSLVGALPPVAGWVAAGGSVTDPKILLVASFFFIWQIPHFWILLLVYGKDYDKGGFPTLTNVFSIRQLINITFCWIVLTIVTALSFNFFGIFNYFMTGVFLILLCGWLFIQSLKFLRSNGESRILKNMFISINIFTLLIITSLTLDKLIKLFLE
ncbi:MAG: protoheme IX farnesyltransferase [Ignavibacteria bacterium]|nr:protoheme IX farnesyltransferase [Ignavibacteria bacterium]